jgi:hypothetical protein
LSKPTMVKNSNLSKSVGLSTYIMVVVVLQQQSVVGFQSDVSHVVEMVAFRDFNRFSSMHHWLQTSFLLVLVLVVVVHFVVVFGGIVDVFDHCTRVKRQMFITGTGGNGSECYGQWFYTCVEKALQKR